MKKIAPIILLAVTAILAGCEKQKDLSGLIDAGIAINGTTQTTKTSTVPAPGEMTPEDSVAFIVKYAHEWWCADKGHRSFSAQDRDFERNRLMFYGIDVMYNEETLGHMITDDKIYDIVFVVTYTKEGLVLPDEEFDSREFTRQDTVAYLPNEVLFRARREIKAAFAAKDYERCFELFDKAFIFVPTTGPRWRALKAAGIE